MTVYEWLCILGIPAIVAGFVTWLVRTRYAQMKGVKLGIQALLRAQLIADYNKWSEEGYAPIYARQNFENCWYQYHALGANGVMDDIHAKFFELPTEAPEDEKAEE